MTIMATQHSDTQPWWKEPWPWIIMAGPFVALVGCAITIGLAVKHFSGQAIVDGGVRQGLVVKRLGSDRPQAPMAGASVSGSATQEPARGQP
ncbi:MAG: hypothetical protein WCY47_03675 [Pusillimonas sp.]